MARTVYQTAIYNMIDFKEEVYAKYKKLLESSNEDINFTENPDGSIACCIKYRDYDVAFRITENEVFERALRSKDIVNSIQQIIEEKLLIEIKKEKE